MAHFAELDDNNIVLRVVLIDNKDTSDANGNEVEEIGIAYLENLLGGKWLQTSYNHKIRGMFAGQGSNYDPVSNRFYSGQTFASWKLNKETLTWEPPIPRPSDGNFYVWNEDKVNWDLIQDISVEDN